MWQNAPEGTLGGGFVGVEGIRLTGLYGDWGRRGGGLFLGSVRQHRVSRSRRREEDGEAGVMKLGSVEGGFGFAVFGISIRTPLPKQHKLQKRLDGGGKDGRGSRCWRLL